jgi:hypothetical protein
MAGTVGNSNIRNDIRQTARDRTPESLIPSFIERGTRTRLDNIIQPFERARTTEVKTLVEFYNLLRKVLEAAAEIDGLAHPVRITQEFPPIETVLPCFSIKLIKRMPLDLKGIKEVSPRYMTTNLDPNYPGEQISEYMMRQDNVIEVTTWAKTNKVANDQAEWLEEKFWEYLWTLQWGGIAHPVRWLGRGEDIYKQIRDQQMYGAPAVFGIVTCKITKRRATSIRKIDISIGILEEERSETDTLE